MPDKFFRIVASPIFSESSALSKGLIRDSKEEKDGYHSDATVDENNRTCIETTNTAARRIETNKRQFHKISQVPSKRHRSNTQWTDNVQNAFEEAISVIPKKSLKNIKINGLSQGRNKYIGMFIQHKTGIHRTPKQISSHIQGLCSSKQEYRFKRLLIDGPEENKELIRNFYNLFTSIAQQYQTAQTSKEINANKTENTPKLPLLAEHVLDFERPVATSTGSATEVTVKKIDMCYVNFKVLKDSHVFSKFDGSIIGRLPEISLTTNTLRDQYPDISRLLNINNNPDVIRPKVPFILSNVMLSVPPFETDLISGNYNFTLKLTLSNMPRKICYNVVTIVKSKNGATETRIEKLLYSSSKSKTDHTFNLDVASAYWKKFFQNKILEENIGDACSIEDDIDHTSIQQYLVDSTLQIAKDFDINSVDSKAIKCIFLWKFTHCNILDDALLKISNVTELRNFGTPLRSTSNETLNNPINFKLATPLSIIAEQRHHSTKKIKLFSTPSRATNDPLALQNLTFTNQQSKNTNTLITPPHTGVLHSPVDAIGPLDRTFLKPGPVLFSGHEDINYIPHNLKKMNPQTFSDIVVNNQLFFQPNNIPINGPSGIQNVAESEASIDIEHALNLNKKHSSSDNFDESFEDYKDIFSDPNLQMYEFI